MEKELSTAQKTFMGLAVLLLAIIAIVAIIAFVPGYILVWVFVLLCGASCIGIAYMVGDVMFG